MKRKILTLSILSCLISTSAQAQYAQGGRIAGKDGWFFLVDEFRYFKQERPEIVYDTTDTLSLIDKILKDKDVDFYPTIVPIRSRIYADSLPDGLILPPQIVNRYDTILAEFRRNGLREVDLNTLFLSIAKKSTSAFPLFIKGDHHWSSVGSMAAARLVSDQINKNVDLSRYPIVESTIRVNDPTILAKATLVADDRPAAKVQTEFYLPVFVDKMASSDLLGDGGQPIVLVGDSFARGEDFNAGFFPYGSIIENYTKHEVFNYAKEGIGAWTPLLDYFRSTNYRENLPKVLVWEMWEIYAAGLRYPIPENYLSDIGPAAMGNCKDPVAINSQGQVIKTGRANYNIASYINFDLSKKFNADSITFNYSNSSVTKNLYKSTDDVIQYNILVPFRNSKLESIAVNDSNGKIIPISKFDLCEMPKYFVDAISLNGKSADYNSRDFRGVLKTDGFYDSSDLQNVRWGLGKKSNIYFNSSRMTTGILSLDIYSPFPNQSIIVSVNGKENRILKTDSGGKIKYRGNFSSQIGENVLTFSYSDWKTKNSDDLKLVDVNDPRDLAVQFSDLTISLR